MWQGRCSSNDLRLESTKIRAEVGFGFKFGFKFEYKFGYEVGFEVGFELVDAFCVHLRFNSKLKLM